MKYEKLNISLTNDALYAGCIIQEVAGRLTLCTPSSEASTIVRRNATEIIDSMVAKEVEVLTLEGAMAIWVYLIVFHQAVHRFRRIYYDDGKPGEPILVATH